MSGWWFAASASSATRLMNASAGGKSSNFQVRAIALPVRVHFGTSARRAAISSSVSSVRRAMVYPRERGGALKVWRASSADDDDRRLRHEVRRPRDVEADPQEVRVVRVRPAVRGLDVRGDRDLEHERLADLDPVHRDL